MIKWRNNIVSSIVFLIVNFLVYLTFTKEVSASLLITTIIFFGLLIGYDLLKYED